MHVRASILIHHLLLFILGVNPQYIRLKINFKSRVRRLDLKKRFLEENIVFRNE